MDQLGLRVLAPRSLVRRPMPLYIKDETTLHLTDQLAKRLGLPKQEAVRGVAEAELERAKEAVPLRDRFAALRADHPLPAATGKVADRAFFDDVAGGL